MVLLLVAPLSRVKVQEDNCKSFKIDYVVCPMNNELNWSAIQFNVILEKNIYSIYIYILLSYVDRRLDTWINLDTVITKTH